LKLEQFGRIERKGGLMKEITESIGAEANQIGSIAENQTVSAQQITAAAEEAARIL
jgi:hypothetical protein